MCSSCNTLWVSYPHCLSRPCVTAESFHRAGGSNIQQSQMLREIPPTLHKQMYTNLWTMLHHRGVWQLEKYHNKKAAALSLDPKRRTFVYHHRDIMPSCVLKVACGWCPNPDGVPLWVTCGSRRSRWTSFISTGQLLPAVTGLFLYRSREQENYMIWYVIYELHHEIMLFYTLFPLMSSKVIHT